MTYCCRRLCRERWPVWWWWWWTNQRLKNCNWNCNWRRRTGGGPEDDWRSEQVQKSRGSRLYGHKPAGLPFDIKQLQTHKTKKKGMRACTTAVVAAAAAWPQNLFVCVRGRPSNCSLLLAAAAVVVFGGYLEALQLSRRNTSQQQLAGRQAGREGGKGVRLSTNAERCQVKGATATTRPETSL